MRTAVPVLFTGLTPDKDSCTRSEHHQHFPDEQRQEDQPITDLDVLIDSQCEQNGKDQQRARHDKTPKMMYRVA